MAENEAGADDRTEEATPERRDEFRERGQVVISRDLTSVALLASCAVFLTATAGAGLARIERLLVAQFESIATRRIGAEDVLSYLGEVWKEILWLTIPIFLIVATVSVALTFAQTRLNWSWDRTKPDWSRLNPFPGLLRMFNLQALVELTKSFAKTCAVSLVAYLILHREWARVPALVHFTIQASTAYFSAITRNLVWAVCGFMFVIGAFDYIYNFITTERQMRMTKQEVKEEFKRREIDPHVKGKMRRMFRDIVNRKTVEKTRKATVLITNPTHFSIALKYEVGDKAPTLLAKGIDLVALRMREVAKELEIPIIENRPLARELYATVKEGEEIPDKFYKAVAEIVRYVFKLKGRRLPQRTPPAKATPSSVPPGPPVS